MKVLISFVIPVYKVEKYIQQCLESVLSQFVDEIEVILVDDGSPDMCPTICDEYARKDKRVRVIHKKNKGVSLARAEGILQAKGEYIVCIDSDDWISSEFSKVIKDTILKYQPDVVRYGYFLATKECNYKKCPEIEAGIYDKERIKKIVYPILLEGKPYFINSLWSCVIRRELIQTLCLKNVRVIMGEDAASLKPCIFYSNSMVVLNECLYFYRKTDTSIIQSKPVLPWDGPILIKNHYIRTIESADSFILNQIEVNAVHNLFNVVVSQFYSKKSYSKTKKDIIEHLSSSEYRFINTCSTKTYSWKLKFAKFVLLKKWIFLIYLYWKIFARR